jgi:hypothetical protein
MRRPEGQRIAFEFRQHVIPVDVVIAREVPSINAGKGAF